MEGKKTSGGKGKRSVPHFIGNIIGIAFIAVLLPMMIINITLIVKSYTRPNQVPTVFGVAPLIVQSGSMDPAIKVDDLILVREVDAKKLKAGDVVAFQPAGVTTVITHRIVEVYDESGATMFRTKGDATNTEDVDPVHYNQVVGQYFHRIAKLGSVAMFLQQPVGMVVFVVVPLALFLLYDLLRRYFYNKKHKDDSNTDQEELERLRALAASLEQGAAAPAFVPAPDIVHPASEPEPDLQPAPETEAEADLDEDDADEV